jgi:hypothetical protein
VRTPALIALALLAGCGDSAVPPPPPGTPPAAATPTTARSTQGTRSSQPVKVQEQESSDEAIAQLLLEDAGKKGSPDRPDLVMTAHHDVCVRHPFTKAGRKAAARCVEVEADLVKMTDREFAGARDAAEAMRREGRFADAVASVRKYSDSVTKEPLKRRAAAYVAMVENEARGAYVKAVLAARKALAGGAVEEAVKLLKAASEKSTEDVKAAAEGDLVLLDRHGRAEEAKRTKAAEEQALNAFGDRAVYVLKRVRERAYPEALKDLDAAIADPSLAVCKDRLIADRAAVAAAASFWDAIQKTLKARVNQEVILKKAADKEPAKGILKKVNESGLSVRLDTSSAEIPLAELDSDTLLLLGINRDGLPEDAGASYAAAGIWFFMEGRHDISRLQLATASEMKADLTRLEPAWRQGFLRLAMRP